MQDNLKLTILMADPYIQDILNQAQDIIKRGGIVYFKWTCTGCGERVISDLSNELATSYKHEDCGHITETVYGNLGFLVIWTGIRLDGGNGNHAPT